MLPLYVSNTVACLSRAVACGRTAHLAGPMVSTTKGRLGFFLWLALVSSSTAASAAIYFVDAGAPAGGNGASWPTAFRDPQNALAIALDGDQVWIAEGTYFPTQGTNRAVSFDVPPGVEVYGGFEGVESDIDERNPESHPTILSGDLGENDQPNFLVRGDNSRHVVIAREPDETRIDGLIIERGNFNLSGDLLEGGGGLFVIATGGSPKHVIVDGCILRENSAGQNFQELGNFGGGLLVRGSDATITSCTFEHNRANAGGGLALFHQDAAGNDVDMTARVEDCAFLDNLVPTQTGGGMWSLMGRSVTEENIGHLDVERCRFEGNFAGYWGAWIDQNTTFLNISECEFVENSSNVTGGALGVLQTGGVDTDPARIDHCIFSDNQTDGSGGGLWAGAADVILRHCAFLGNNAVVGGGIFSAGYFQEGGAQDLILENCLLQGNVAQDAGAIRSGFNPTFRLVSSTVALNEATVGNSAGVLTRGGFIDIDNAILYANTGANGVSQSSQIIHVDGGPISINFSLVDHWSGSLGGVGNFGGDPMFLDPLGEDGEPGTGDEDLAIGAGSPCIDAGSNLVLPVGLDFDLAGNPRRTDDPNTPDTGAGVAPITDIGAYEFQAGTSDVVESNRSDGVELSLWPNPSSRYLQIAFEQSQGSRVRVEVVDAGGRIVAIPFDDHLEAGRHQLHLDVRGATGRNANLSSGIYWIRVTDDREMRSARLALTR